MSSTAENQVQEVNIVAPAVDQTDSTPDVVNQNDSAPDTVIDIPPEVEQELDDEQEVGDEQGELKDIVKDDPDVDPEIEQDTKVITWNGQRPFAGAVEQYKTLLKDALKDAEEHLATNPGHVFARVKLPLFDTLTVKCTDAKGEDVEKKFTVHEAHYGPMAHTNFHPSVPAEHRRWLGFYNRFHMIWVLMGQTGKASGGDGSGKDGTACAPFRDAQVEFLNKGLYLFDASQVEFDQEKGRYWFNIQIYLYRSPPQNGPYRVPHGYGFIPGLGPAHTAVQIVNDQAPSSEQKTRSSNRGQNQRGRGGNQRVGNQTQRGGNQTHRGGNQTHRGGDQRKRGAPSTKGSNWATDN